MFARLKEHVILSCLTTTNDNEDIGRRQEEISQEVIQKYKEVDLLKATRPSLIMSVT